MNKQSKLKEEVSEKGNTRTVFPGLTLPVSWYKTLELITRLVSLNHSNAYHQSSVKLEPIRVPVNRKHLIPIWNFWKG